MNYDFITHVRKNGTRALNNEFDRIIFPLKRITCSRKSCPEDNNYGMIDGGEIEEIELYEGINPNIIQEATFEDKEDHYNIKKLVYRGHVYYLQVRKVYSTGFVEELYLDLRWPGHNPIFEFYHIRTHKMVIKGDFLSQKFSTVKTYEYSPEKLEIAGRTEENLDLYYDYQMHHFTMEVFEGYGDPRDMITDDLEIYIREGDLKALVMRTRVVKRLSIMYNGYNEELTAATKYYLSWIPEFEFFYYCEEYDLDFLRSLCSSLASAEKVILTTVDEVIDEELYQELKELIPSKDVEFVVKVEDIDPYYDEISTYNYDKHHFRTGKGENIDHRTAQEYNLVDELVEIIEKLPEDYSPVVNLNYKIGGALNAFIDYLLVNFGGYLDKSSHKISSYKIDPKELILNQDSSMDDITKSINDIALQNFNKVYEEGVMLIKNQLSKQDQRLINELDDKFLLAKNCFAGIKKHSMKTPINLWGYYVEFENELWKLTEEISPEFGKFMREKYFFNFDHLKEINIDIIDSEIVKTSNKQLIRENSEISQPTYRLSNLYSITMYEEIMSHMLHHY